MKAIILRRPRLGRTSCKEIAARMNNEVTVVRNDMEIHPATHVIRWGTTSNVPACEGQIIYNSAASIHWCADKKGSRLELQKYGVSVPMSWELRDWLNHVRLLGNDEQEYVLRRDKHAQGKNLWCGNAEYIRQQILVNAVHEGYVSVFIDKVSEYRVFVCQGKVVWVAKKTPGDPNAVAWNVAQGGRFDNVRWGEWPLEACHQAILAAIVSKTDFCGVDVMLDSDGMAYVLEVNSAPSQTSPYRQECVAKAFDYMIENGKRILVCGREKNWKSVIHPAIWRVE